jgi:hypothetical protein
MEVKENRCYGVWLMVVIASPAPKDIIEWVRDQHDTTDISLRPP